MKITSIEVRTVLVPAVPGAINSVSRDLPLHKLGDEVEDAWSRQFDEVEKPVLIAHTDDGFTGIGEGLRGLALDDVATVAARFIGADVRTLSPRRLPVPRSRMYDGFECLVLDLLGRVSGLPVHALLGGAVRDQLAVGAWSGHRSAADAADVALAALEDGYTTLKLKCDAEDDIGGIAQSVQDATDGKMQLIFDPNERLRDVRTALPVLRELEAVGNVLCVEDPLPHWNLAGYRHLRDRCDVPIAVHVALGYVAHGQRPQMLLDAFNIGAADMYNLSGAIGDFLDMAAVAETQGLSCWHGSEVDLGVLEAAYVHAAACAPASTLPSDVFGRRIRSHDLLQTPLAIADGQVSVPTGPGLGVDLDLDAVERHTTGMRIVS